MPESRRLSDKSALILGLIAEGNSYSQIVDGQRGINYLDIFAAAEEALSLNESPSDYHKRMEQIKSRHARAYERWDTAEDARLASMQRSGNSVSEIARALQRQPSAIRSRLAKPNLTVAD